MKTLILVALAFTGTLAWAECKTGAWKEVVDCDGGKYEVAYEPGSDKVDVTKLDDGKAPSSVKLKIHRKDAKPFDLSLHTLAVPDQPIRYEGDLREWKDQSVVGFELGMSFDKKSWKSVKRFFGAGK